MTSVSQRQDIVAMVDQAIVDGATRTRACEVVGICDSTLRRWRPVDSDTVIEDGRPLADRPPPANQYSEAERNTILDFCNRPEYASLPPSQIVPLLADEKVYIGSESTIYRALKAAGQIHHRGRAKTRTTRSTPTTHEATAPNQVWMMDVTWLPTRVNGQFYYLYMVEDLYSRFGVYWEVFDVCSARRYCTTTMAARWSHTRSTRKCCRWALRPVDRAPVSATTMRSLSRYSVPSNIARCGRRRALPA